jgi:PAS domain S-box-containing protein
MADTADVVNALSFARFRQSAKILHEPPQFLDQLPIAIYACEAQGRLCWYNRRAAAIWGREPKLGDSRQLFEGSFRLRGLNGELLRPEETPMARVLATARPLHGKDVVIERPDGSRLTVLVHIDPLLDDTGGLIGAVSCFHDITGMKAAERQARDSERRLRDLLEALPVAVYTTDAQGYITSFNEAAAALWQHRPTLGESQWCGSWRLRKHTGELMRHDECPMALTLKQKGNFRGSEAMLERKDGTCIPFLAFPSLLRDGAGRITGAVNMLVDISDRKQAEERQKTLVDELNHRVKNTLATVHSLASNTAREAALPSDLRATFEGRLITLSRTHDHLTSSGWQSANLQLIIEEILAPHVAGCRHAIDVSGPPVDLSPRQALALAMVVNELAANALRHGSLSSEKGELKIKWTIKGRRKTPVLHIDWIETGGPAATSPDRKGFGTRLVERSIRSELNGTLDLKYGKAGLHGVIAFPLV